MSPRAEMTLIVDAPLGYEPERRYVLDAVLGEWLGLDWRLRQRDRGDVRITLQGGGREGVTLPDALFATPEHEWLTPASLPRMPCPRRPAVAPRAHPAGDEVLLPVLYGADPAAAELLAGEGPQVHVGVDVFGSAFFMLTRYEELVVDDRDKHGRFPASSSLAYREGFLERPIVDAYVEVLWSALRLLWPRLRRRPRGFALALTHDVDRPLAAQGITPAGRARQLGADWLVRREPRLAVQRLRSWRAASRGDHRLDPYNTFGYLMDVSERHGIASAFYFLATPERSFLDGFYAVEDPWIQSLMRRMHQRGHEIGFHAGFHTFRDLDRTREEFGRLRTAARAAGVSRETWGGRQHYLRWENPATWSNWEQAGLQYDSTLGFAERIGFRSGTCHSFRTFHVTERRPMRLYERPLHAMDVTLSDYMGLSAEAAAEAMLRLKTECRRYEGTLTLLWHNNSLASARRRDEYAALISDLARSA